MTSRPMRLVLYASLGLLLGAAVEWALPRWGQR